MGAKNSRLLGRQSKGAALLKATRNGDVARAEEILDANPAAAAYCTLEGLTPLHVAAAARNAVLLERLLIALRQAAASQRRPAKAANKFFSKTVNQKNVHGQTVLMLACKAGVADCVRLLIEAQADATLFDDLNQRSCLHYAAMYGWAEAIEALLEDESVVRGGDGQQLPLREALMADSQGHHKYIDGRDGYGLAALHLSASMGHLAAVKVLLKFGACLTVRCNVAYKLGSTDPWKPASTPLHFAAAGRGRIVAAILQAAAEQEQQAVSEGRGPPLDIRLLQDFRGHRPYDIAIARGYRSIAWALNPRVPLAALLHSAAAAPAVPTLAMLAAAALRCQLAQCLTQLEDAARTNSGMIEAGGSKRSGTSPSREGSGHGISSYAAYVAATAAAGRPVQLLAARLSGSPAVAGLSTDTSGNAPGRQVGMNCSFPAAAMHARRASDSGINGNLHTFQPPAAAQPSARGGSWRGGRSSVDPGFLPGSAPAAQELGLLSASATASPAAVGLLGAADAAFTGSPLISCARTATSVTSVAGCPVCLDSRLEVAISPCGHGLCLDCAKHLIQAEEGCRGALATTAALPLCPLCRGLMAGFKMMPA